MKNKFSKISTAILLLSLILFFLTYTLFREKGKESFQENRKLASLPKISIESLLDGSFMREFSDCFTDHFAGRSYWISAKGYIDAQVGESIVNDVYIDDDMLLYAGEPFTLPFDDISTEINQYAADYEGAVYFTAVPTSSGVYTDRLPEYLTHNTEQQQIDQLYSSFSSEIKKIDSYSILKMLNENYIYYRNDSKWTSYGAYCVYRTVIQKLGFLPTAYDKYTIEHVTGEFRGNLYNKSQYTGIKEDMLDIYSYDDGEEIISCTAIDEDGNTVHDKKLYDRSYIGTNDMYKLYLGNEAPIIKIKTSVNNEKKLLIIKDDYANCFIPFLVQHYSEITVASPEYMKNGLGYYLDKNDYAQTLFLFGVDTLSENINLSIINK